jgi:ABC-type antimicrobial peptide transport system permease subunit
MEKINQLLVKLDNKVTPNIAKRLDGLKKLNEKVALAEREYHDNPTDESEESMNDINEYVSDIVDGLIEDLEDLLESKKQQQELAKAKQQELAKAKQQELAKAKEQELAKAQEQNKPVTPNENIAQVIPEKKKGLGVFGLVLGVVVIVGSLGALNIMKNNR